MVPSRDTLEPTCSRGRFRSAPGHSEQFLILDGLWAFVPHNLMIRTTIFVKFANNISMHLCIHVKWSITTWWFVKMLVYFSFCCVEVNCLLAHSVIHMNGGRPKAALVGLRFTCPWRAAEGRPCRWKTDCCTFVFKACGIIRSFTMPHQLIATFATESRMSRLHLTCHKPKANISFGPPLAGLNF